ncbi:hypothetical protein T439DRAFT_325386 [Meredithblackwellia eburnea MCA 4105]
MTSPRAFFLPSSSLILLAATLLAIQVQAIGDFPCSGSSDSQTCAQWSTDTQAQGVIAATAVCQPDPINPSVSYCGYAAAACTKASECDYGSCGSDGKCKGYAGDPCPNGNTDCQAFFFCGTDKTCGGVGAACANGDASSPIPSPDQQCTSNSCDQTAKTCNAPPAAGMPVGSACGNDDVCASGVCGTSSSLCTTVQAASQRARRTKRFVHNGDATDALECPAGFTACAVGSGISEGFECIDSLTDLEQCGGCVSPFGSNEGQDCTAIGGVESVSCKAGTCFVESCVAGFTVSPDSQACLRHQ